LLPGDELVRHTEKDFARSVLANLSAKRTLNGNRLKGEFLPARWHIAAAPLAGDYERLAARERQEHGSMVGEYKAKV